MRIQASRGEHCIHGLYQPVRQVRWDGDGATAGTAHFRKAGIYFTVAISGTVQYNTYLQYSTTNWPVVEIHRCAASPHPVDLRI